MTIDLELLEIEILLYLLNGREQLGSHADSAKLKLNRARRQILESFNTTENLRQPEARTLFDGMEV